MKDAISLRVSLPKIPDIELVAIEGLERLARHLGIADEKVGEAKVLVTEAIINALEHSGEDNPVVKVEFTITKQELIILVRDYGKGFEPSSVGDPDIRGKMGTKDKRGWGLKLMKTMSDDFRIESNTHGTRITIKKLLS
ncbi:MAG TPA: ATP-binding protein [Bacteroidetes bacterium]|jgi:serine/threonine-protein kinase RsbW|nr:ATP-binding protein [Bacteroidota bacterium]